MYIRREKNYRGSNIIFPELHTKSVQNWSYSTINQLFSIGPSPTVGNSGERCHSPSTKNLISYLNEIKKLLVNKEKAEEEA